MTIIQILYHPSMGLLGLGDDGNLYVYNSNLKEQKWDLA